MSSHPTSHDFDQFFGAYFHEDWDLEAEDWEGIVDLYSSSPTRTPERLRLLADRIDEMRENQSETEICTTVVGMGGCYDPRPERTYDSWLRQVTERLRRHASAAENHTAG
ncbi:contact-dependent growth inhibition system immunity protein [[Mycobacterium] wendilense]|uniref:Contact-dependent growth inhibition system immunity protein n=1 Tax=[Mycobacterium] wendilense TaxID=3064284 RepID=A0ABN9NTM7_9MYCO|nr:contact-dependent growth inhibition system immunity protein [Mycolicibacterium sp. MU0050]CAJ1579259.1 contact-dependent growth inhibition system immunity protein [Mycolicibacterium sp. MU0050]